MSYYDDNVESDDNDISGLDMTEIFLPVVFRIVCTATNRAYFGSALCILPRVVEFLDNFANDSFDSKLFSDNQILKDWRMYRPECFSSTIVVSGLEFADEEKRQMALEKAKNDWSGELYVK